MNVYGLIGYPLEHSFSKKYFTEKFRNENISARFELFPVQSLSELPQIIAGEDTLKGLAVTIPHKVNVIPFLTRLTENAQHIGAVNCIQFARGESIGHNTDAIGFEKSLLPLLNKQTKGALILGKGGAAMAVKFILEKIGLPYHFVTREPSIAPGDISYTQLTKELMREYSLIINCTPVGMHPNENNMPSIPYDLLTSANILYDLIYNPEETLFLKKGKERGCVIKNGFEMLVLQAEENWKIWNNI